MSAQETQTQTDEMSIEIGKKSISFEAIIKIIVYVVIGTLAWANISYKVDNTSEAVKSMQAKQDKKDEQWNLEKGIIQTQISTCNLEIKVIQQQLEDMKK